jgi:hypothetical protein
MKTKCKTKGKMAFSYYLNGFYNYSDLRFRGASNGW